MILANIKLRGRSITIPSARALLCVAVLAALVGACTYSSTTAALSGPAAIGVPQEVDLWDCGDAPSGPTIVDFDESLWVPVGADPYEALESPSSGGGGPVDTGTMTLVAPDRAEYRTDHGSVFTFQRYGDESTFEGCVPMALPRDTAGEDHP